MTKLQKLLFQDYLADKTDLRLKLYVNSINPDFTINKKNKAEIELMISDITKTIPPDKMRIKILESFLSSKGPNRVDVLSPATKSPSKLSVLLTSAPGSDKSAIRRIELARLINDWKKAHMGSSWKDITSEDRKEYDTFKKELTELETLAGMYKDDPEAQEKSEMSLLRGILGDWNDTRTYAYMILNGGAQTMTIKSYIDINTLLSWLQRYSGKEPRQFHITKQVGDSLKGPDGKNGTKYVLVDKASGLGAAPSMLITNADTGADLTASALGGMLSTPLIQ